jgi:glycine receptor alpha-3
MRDIRYIWADGMSSVGVSNEVSLPQFKVMGYRQRANEISLSTGNYSRLACDILFVRSMGYYLIQIYIPSSELLSILKSD